MIEVKKYDETGFLFPIDVVGTEEIKLIRKDFELAENELTDDPKRLSLLRSYPAQLLPSFDKLIRNENLVVANDDYSLVSYIEGRRKRLIANNLIIGSSFQLSNNYDNRYDKRNFKQWKLKLKSSGNLASLVSKKNNQGKKLVSDLEFS